MSNTIAANVTRATVPVRPTAISVQLDLMNPLQAAAYGGAQAGEAPYFRYNAFTTDSITLETGDLLTDVKNVDQFGQLKRYRIIGEPEYFETDNSWQFVVDRVIIKGAS